MNTMPWWASVAGSLGFSLAWPQPCRRGCRTGASQATGNSHHPAMRPPATHRPHGVRLAAAGDLHHQLHVGVVVSVAAPRHVHKLVRQADIPATGNRRRVLMSEQGGGPRSQGGRVPGAAPEGGPKCRETCGPSEPLPRHDAGGRTRCHRWAHCRAPCRPARGHPLGVGPPPVGARGLVLPRLPATHSALAATSSGVAIATKCRTPSLRKVWYAQRRMERIHLAAPTGQGGDSQGLHTSRGKARRPSAPAGPGHTRVGSTHVHCWPPGSCG